MLIVQLHELGARNEQPHRISGCFRYLFEFCKYTRHGQRFGFHNEALRVFGILGRQVMRVLWK